jgi:uncharacterized membrane protein YfcA
MLNIAFLTGILLAGFVAPFIDGTLGMGYGVSSSSLLVAIGLAPAIASASVHTAQTQDGYPRSDHWAGVLPLGHRGGAC